MPLAPLVDLFELQKLEVREPQLRTRTHGHGPKRVRHAHFQQHTEPRRNTTECDERSTQTRFQPLLRVVARGGLRREFGRVRLVRLRSERLRVWRVGVRGASTSDFDDSERRRRPAAEGLMCIVAGDVRCRLP